MEPGAVARPRRWPVAGCAAREWRVRRLRPDSPTVDGLTEIEVGYHVRTALQGRGLATEAAAACRDYARDVLGLKWLIAIIDPCNRPSQRVAEQLGLVVERRATTMAAGAAPSASTPRPWLGASEWAVRRSIARPGMADQLACDGNHC